MHSEGLLQIINPRAHAQRRVIVVFLYIYHELYVCMEKLLCLFVSSTVCFGCIFLFRFLHVYVALLMAVGFDRDHIYLT